MPKKQTPSRLKTAKKQRIKEAQDNYNFKHGIKTETQPKKKRWTNLFPNFFKPIHRKKNV